MSIFVQAPAFPSSAAVSTPTSHAHALVKKSSHPYPAALTLTYVAHTAVITGPHLKVAIGPVLVGRGAHLVAPASALKRHANVGTFASRTLSDAFTSKPTSVEQTITVRTRPSGTGYLIVQVPLASTLQAAGSGTSVELRSSPRQARATYSHLKVLDARGLRVPATLSAGVNGHSFVISVRDSRALYPLTIDPIWSMVSSATLAFLPPTSSTTTTTLPSTYYGFTAWSGPTASSSQTLGVSCSSPGNCAAGGSYVDSSGNRQAYIVSQVSGTWGTPIEVAGSLNTGNSATIYSVSCPSDGNCAATGQYRNGFQWKVFVVEEASGVWGGVQEVVAGITFSDNTSFISCPTALNCSIGGEVGVSYTGGAQAFVDDEVNGVWGAGQYVASSLNVGGLGAVGSISCASNGNCVATGLYTDSASHYQPFMVNETSGTWGSAQQVAASLNVGGNGNLDAVSCPSVGNCTAGGYYTDVAGHAQAFVMDQTSGTWGNANEVPPTFNSGGNSDIASMSCVSAANCTAAGYISDTDGHQQILVVTESGGVWGTPQEIVNYFGTSASAQSVSCSSPGNCAISGMYTDYSGKNQSFVAASLNGVWGYAQDISASLNAGSYSYDGTVSCVGTSYCVTGGYYSNSSNVAQSLLDDFNPQSVATAAPGGPTPTYLAPIALSSSLTGITATSSSVNSTSCTGIDDCTAGGSYVDSAGKTQAFVIDEVNGVWSYAMQVAGGLNTFGYAYVSAVSCASPGNCGAIGNYRATSQWHPFVIEETNGVWGQAQELTGTYFTGGMGIITCPSVGNCVAGGDVVTEQSPTYILQALVINEVNGVWQAPQTTAGALNVDNHGWMANVSCASVGNCSATGGYTDASGHYQAFVNSETSGAWGTAQEVAGTLNAGNSAYGGPLACPSAGNCTATGFYTDASAHSQEFAISETSGVWGTAQQIAGTSSSPGTQNGPLACTSAGNCVAAGTYFDSSSILQAFIDVETGGVWGTLQKIAGNLTVKYATVTSLTCTAAGDCAVSGSYKDASSRVEAYIDQAPGGVWGNAQEVAGTLNVGNSADLYSESCDVSNSCVAGGNFTDSSAKQQAVFDNFGTFTLPSIERYAPTGGALGLDAHSAFMGCQYSGIPATHKCGDPVDTSTGDFTVTATDLALPGAGMSLNFTRYYDAQAAQAEVTASAPASPLGFGWSDNYMANVSYNSTTQIATVTEGNGAQTTYAPYVAGTSPTWCTGITNYCATTPRVAATLNQNSGGTWTLVSYNGAPVTYHFSAGGFLTSIANALGDSVSDATYTPAGGQSACPSSNSCVAWTNSASGRELVIASNSSGRITEVFDANSSLASTYAYAGAGCTTWTGSQVPDLCTVAVPGPRYYTYTYDATNANANLVYDVLSATEPGASAPTVNQYNTAGQVTQQSDATGNVMTFSYVGNNAAVSGGQTTVTSYPNGLSGPQHIVVDSYSSNVLVAETTAAGTMTIQRDPASLMPLSTTDANGNVTSFTYQTYSGTGGTQISSANVLTSTDALGNVSARAYNTDNRPYCIVSPAEYFNGVRCPSLAPSAPPAPGASDPNLGAVINFYNVSDQLTATTDGLGNTTTFSYTSGVSGVPNGLDYCTVDPANYQKSVACPAYGAAHVSGTTTLTYDSAGDVLTSTNPDGALTTYAYASTLPGLVSSVVTPDGSTTTYVYNTAGQATSTTVSFGSYSATTLDAFDAYGRQYCAVSPLEASRGVTCPGSPPSSPPTPSSDPYLGATITTYDAAGRLVQVTNPLGGVTYQGYDAAGERFCSVSAHEVALGVTCPNSAPTTAPTIGSDPYLGATITTYDTSGRAVQVTNPLGGIDLTSYDPAGNVISTTSESNNSGAAPNVVMNYTYNADNQVDQITNSSGTTLTSYDPDGNAFCTVSANAYHSSVYQCPTWQAGWIAAPPSPSALYSTTPTSAQANNVTTGFYNAGGLLVQSTNPDVQTSLSVYDADGRSYCSVDAVNFATYLAANPSATYPFDCATTPPTSAPATGSNPGYITTIYDPAGRVLSTTNQLGDTTSHTYNAAGEVLTTSDPRGEVTTNCYLDQNGTGACANGAPAGSGAGGDLYSITTPVTTADPSGIVTTHTYLPGELLATSTSPSGTVTAAYDANADLLSSTWSSVVGGYTVPATTSHTFNVDASVATATDASGVTTYGYDAAGNVLSQTFVAGVGTGLSNNTVSYTYFTSGPLATLTYPAYTGYSVPVVNYAYNSSGQLLASTDWLGNVITYSYDPNGNLTNQNNNSGGATPSSTAFSYDAANNVNAAVSTFNQTCGSPETLTQSLSGTTGSRNANGQLTSSTNTYSTTCSGQSTSTRNYSYDLAGQVVYQGTTTQGASPNNFAYDPSGDPTTISAHVGSSFNTYTQTFDATGATLTQSPASGSGGVSSTYTYDTSGDRLSSVSTTTTSYAFNAAGQMTSATTPSGSTTYLYQANGLEAAATTTPAATPQWNSALDVNGTRAFDVVKCLSATFCVAVGASGYATVFNGTSWSTPSVVDATRTMDALSCVSTTFCVAVDTAGYATIFSGSTWSTPTDIDSTRSVNAVSCTSSAFCVAVGASGYAAVYNGTWGAATAVDSSRTMDGVSCVSSTFCVTGDTTGYSAKYTGTWAAATDIDASRSISTIACVSSTFCVTGDTTGYSATYTGSWAAATDVDAARAIKNVTCVTSSFCLAMDGSGYSATYNGSWATATDVDGSTSLSTLTCVSSTYCVAGDATGNVLVYTGTWAAAKNVDAARSSASIACPTSTFCALVDASGFAVLFTTTTQTWSTPTDVNGTRAFDVVKCLSATFCVAVGASGYATVFNGTSWSTPTVVDATRTMDALSCVSTTFCVAVDTAGYATIYNGSTWSTPVDIDSTRSVNAVSCTSSTFCVAVGASGYAAVYTGSWAAATAVDSTRTMDAVNCVSSTFCVTGDTTGYSAKYTGTWAAPTDIDASRSISTISCISSTFCVTGDTTGYSAKYTGTWAATTDIDSSRSIKNIACVSTTFCVAVDGSGYSATYSGSWAATTDIDNASSLNSLSCASATYCVAGDSAGNVLTYTGNSWSYPTSVDASRISASVSCPTLTFCALVDASGYAATYAPVAAPATTTSQLTWDTASNVLSDGTYDFVYGPSGTPVEAITLAASTPTYLSFLPDAQTWVATNEAGDLVSFWGYDAFGTLAFGTPATPFGFSGQYTDSTTGFSNLRARFYDTSTGAFTTRDQAFSTTDTAYTYVGGDPVNRSDPFGLCGSSADNSYYPGACATTAAESRAAGAYLESHVSGGVFSISNGLHALADYGAGIANFGVSGITLGYAHVSIPYCGSNWAYGVGEGYGVAATSLLGVGEYDLAAGAEETVASEEAQGGVYSLSDESGNIVRTGRSSNLYQRSLVHGRNPVLGQFRFNVEYRTDVYAEQRGLEQALYDQNPGAQASNGGFNFIRGISPTNPKGPLYVEAATDYLARLVSSAG